MDLLSPSKYLSHRIRRRLCYILFNRKKDDRMNFPTFKIDDSYKSFKKTFADIELDIDKILDEISTKIVPLEGDLTNNDGSTKLLKQQKRKIINFLVKNKSCTTISGIKSPDDEFYKSIKHYLKLDLSNKKKCNDFIDDICTKKPNPNNSKTIKTKQRELTSLDATLNPDLCSHTVRVRKYDDASNLLITSFKIIHKQCKNHVSEVPKTSQNQCFCNTHRCTFDGCPNMRINKTVGPVKETSDSGDEGHIKHEPTRFCQIHQS